jgi:hypothetical protein
LLSPAFSSLLDDLALAGYQKALSPRHDGRQCVATVGPSVAVDPHALVTQLERHRHRHRTGMDVDADTASAMCPRSATSPSLTSLIADLTRLTIVS